MYSKNALHKPVFMQWLQPRPSHYDIIVQYASTGVTTAPAHNPGFRSTYEMFSSQDTGSWNQPVGGGGGGGAQP